MEPYKHRILPENMRQPFARTGTKCAIPENSYQPFVHPGTLCYTLKFVISVDNLNQDIGLCPAFNPSSVIRLCGHSLFLLQLSLAMLQHAAAFWQLYSSVSTCSFCVDAVSLRQSAIVS